MKPTFALDLTREAIALLHRTPKGWLPIGEVAFDAPDLAETLDYLRKTALGLSPMGMACKLILPNSQILYTEVYAPGPSREDKRRQIAAALEGRTPYAVEDLVFDWSGKGQTVKVAVVARETLEEAEAFAVSHRLNPVSFVAISESGDFVGEPWFGPSAAAESILAPGESVDRDREPVVILQRDPPPAAPVAAGADAPVAGADAPVAAAALGQVPAEGSAQDMARPPSDRSLAGDEDEPLPGLEEALNADTPLPALVDPAHAPPPVAAQDDSLDDLDEDALAAALADAPEPLSTEKTAQPQPNADLPKADLPEPALPDPALPDPPLPDPALPDPPLPEPAPTNPVQPDKSAATAEAGDPARTGPAPFAPEAATAPDPAPSAAPDSAAPPAEPEEAPFAHVADATPEEAPPARPVPSVLDDDLPPAPPAAAMVAFASRRAAAGTTTAKPLDGATRPAAQAPAPSATPAPATAAPSVPPGRAAQPARPAPASRSFPGLVTAPSIPGSRPRPKGKPGLPDPAIAAATVSARPAPVKSPARPGGTFGATAPARNRSGVALMVLVGLLLLFLAFIAAVSSYFLSGNGSTTRDSVQLADPVAVLPQGSLPGVEDEMLADMQDPEGMTAPLPEAEGPALAGGDAGALATESAAVVPETQAETAAETPAETAPENAAETPPEAEPVDPVDLAALAEDQDPVPPPAPAAESPARPVVTVIAAPETAAPETAAPAEPAAEPVAEPASEAAPNTVVATDVTAAQAPVEDQDEIFLAAMDAPPPALDALALPAPAPVADQTPPAPLPPPAFGTVYQFDAQGLLMPTPEGILSPDGVMLFAGPPPLVPPTRSEAAAAAARTAAALAPPVAAEEPVDPATTAADASLVTGSANPDPVAAAEAAPPVADPTLSGFRPRPRPEGLAPGPEDDAALDTAGDSEFATIRPLPRPQVVLAAAAAARPADPVDLGAQGASLAAQAEADLAAAAALEAENPSIVAISRRPEPRPDDLSRAVEAAVAAAVREPEVVAAAAEPDLKPEEIDELDEPSADTGPSIPTNANVAKQATFANAINLSKMNLIGTYGTESRRTALIRQSNGRYKKVKVGDKIDGGTVMAITEGEVRYQKGGKLLTLAMPKA